MNKVKNKDKAQNKESTEFELIKAIMINGIIWAAISFASILSTTFIIIPGMFDEYSPDWNAMMIISSAAILLIATIGVIALAPRTMDSSMPKNTENLEMLKKDLRNEGILIIFGIGALFLLVFGGLMQIFNPYELNNMYPPNIRSILAITSGGFAYAIILSIIVLTIRSIIVKNNISLFHFF